MHSNTGENLFSCKKRFNLFTAVVYEGNSMDTIGVHYITARVCVCVCVCVCVRVFACTSTCWHVLVKFYIHEYALR